MRPPIGDYGSSQSNFGSFRVELLKSVDGPVFIQLRNNGWQSALVLRHADLANEITFERQQPDGSYGPIPRESPPGTEIDYRELADTDWCLLENGDGASWTLAFDETGNLIVGDKVRVTWRPPSETPPKMFSWGKAFPPKERSITVVVASLGAPRENHAR